MTKVSNSGSAPMTDDFKLEFEDEEKNTKTASTKVLAFLFSYFGLTLIVMAYCVGGAFLFQFMEKNLEDERKKEKMLFIHEINNQVINITSNLWSLINSNEGDYSAWTFNGTAVINTWRDSIVRCVRKYDCEAENTTYGLLSEDEGIYDWELPNAILYCVTVISTIGYGNIAPVSDEGRIVTIFYAIFGLPLMLICLSRIGDVMADGVRWMYGRFCCFCCNRKRRLNKYSDRMKEITEPPTTKRAMRAREEYSPLTGDEVEKRIMFEVVHEMETSILEITVPVSMTLVIISLYLVVGAVLFNTWEGWGSMVVGAYFSFVTLSTIGLGDYVPGATAFRSDSNFEMLLASLYIFLGLSVLSMSFSLMQEEMEEKFAWVGKKIGVVEKNGEVDIEKEDDETELRRIRRERKKRLDEERKSKKRKQLKPLPPLPTRDQKHNIPSTNNNPIMARQGMNERGLPPLRNSRRSNGRNDYDSRSDSDVEFDEYDRRREPPRGGSVPSRRELYSR